MNAAGPVFSVATPTPNALDKLKRCVGSVRGQAGLGLEHLVQDGCCVQDACQPCPMQLRWPAVPLARQRMVAKTCISAKSRTHFVAPSRWMAAVARRSPVGRGSALSVIPNGIDLSRYKPIDRAVARELFGLPQHGVVLLCGGALSDTDPRKGFHLLNEALTVMAGKWPAGPITLCIFGSVKRSIVKMLGLSMFSVGQLHDAESIAALYFASNVFVAASLQDNLPNTITEAAACGVPTVAFDIGGISDLVEHGVCGWLAAAGDPVGLARAEMLAVSNPPLRLAAGHAARRHAEMKYSHAKLAAAHMKLYSEAMLRNAA